LRAERVVKVLERLKGWRGTPRVIRLDNGPELTSVQLQAWCESNGVELRFIQPGKPNQNAFIERFNRTFRLEVLNAYLFQGLEQVRERPGGGWWPITKSVHTMRLKGCRRAYSANDWRPKPLLLNCKLDGGAYAGMKYFFIFYITDGVIDLKGVAGLGMFRWARVCEYGNG
jgi:transposase InsO family protein